MQISAPLLIFVVNLLCAMAGLVLSAVSLAQPTSLYASFTGLVLSSSCALLFYQCVSAVCGYPSYLAWRSLFLLAGLFQAIVALLLLTVALAPMLTRGELAGFVPLPFVLAVWPALGASVTFRLAFVRPIRRAIAPAPASAAPVVPTPAPFPPVASTAPARPLPQPVEAFPLQGGYYWMVVAGAK